MKKLITALFAMLAFLAYTYSQSAYLSPVLEHEISHSKEDKLYSILVVMDKQIDFEELKGEFNAKNYSLENRAKTVISLLQNQTNSSQKGVLEFIKEYNQKKGNKVTQVSHLIYVPISLNYSRFFFP